MFVKILSDSWLSKIPITSGENKSFGPITISEFFHALKNVKVGKAKTELEKWIESSGFFKSYPPELVLGHDEEAFARILNAYNEGVQDFLGKCPKFYLWFKPV